MDRQLLSGDEAVALAALHGGVALGTGYPGTPSTEILEAFDALGGRAQWAPNEKVALEVGIGAAFANARTLVTMKHVGLNVAADPLFTAAYTGVTGALIIVTADDPGMSSSQNEQDNRRYAVAAGLPAVEPSDSQEAYDFFLRAVEISERWSIPVLFRMTTRVCHSKSIVEAPAPGTQASVGMIAAGSRSKPHFEHDINARVMIPANARPAHRRLRAKLAEIAQWAETGAWEATAAGSDAMPAGNDASPAGRDSSPAGPDTSRALLPLNRIVAGERSLGIVTSGVSFMHALEAVPGAGVLKIGLVNPLPIERVRAFAATVDRTVVVEEGDPVIADSLLAAGIAVDVKPEMYRFGELDVARVRRIVAGDTSPEPAPARGKPPELCPACPYHTVYATLQKHDCIIAGDIGCYSLGVLPPYRAMDTCVAMGASVGVGLGLRHVLPDAEARRVVSIIGDSTFVHSGIGGLVEMAYNPPATGHVVIVLDNGTTAMTGQQEHPATGRRLDHGPTNQLSIEGLARAIGIPHVTVIDAYAEPEEFERLLLERLAAPELAVIVARRPCILAAAEIRKWEGLATEFRARAAEQSAVCEPAAQEIR